MHSDDTFCAVVGVPYTYAKFVSSRQTDTNPRRSSRRVELNILSCDRNRWMRNAKLFEKIRFDFCSLSFDARFFILDADLIAAWTNMGAAIVLQPSFNRWAYGRLLEIQISSPSLCLSITAAPRRSVAVPALSRYCTVPSRLILLPTRQLPRNNPVSTGESVVSLRRIDNALSSCNSVASSLIVIANALGGSPTHATIIVAYN